MDAVVDSAKAMSCDGDARERNLIAIVDQLARELHPQQARRGVASLSSRLERDLGIDSLGRTELVLRLERSFGTRLPIALVAEADTVDDLKRELEQSKHPGLQIDAPPTAPTLSAISAATEADTLIVVLEWHASQHPDRLHVAMLEDERNFIGRLTYGELAGTSRAIAGGLIERDIMPGDRVALMLPTGPDFFSTFFGVLYAGAIPVPIYPPMQRAQIEQYARNRRESSAMLACGCW
jgi:acyl carrier protein